MGRSRSGRGVGASKDAGPGRVGVTNSTQPS